MGGKDRQSVEIQQKHFDSDGPLDCNCCLSVSTRQKQTGCFCKKNGSSSSVSLLTPFHFFCRASARLDKGCGGRFYFQTSLCGGAAERVVDGADYVKRLLFFSPPFFFFPPDAELRARMKGREGSGR